jgi:hypothetical protein
MPGKIQVNYDLALKDFKYAEENRRKAKAEVKRLTASVADAEKQLVSTQKQLDTANKAYALAANAAIADPTNQTKQSAYKTAQIKVEQLSKQKASDVSRINILKSYVSGYQSIITKLTDITSQTSTVLLEKDKNKNTTSDNVISGAADIKKYTFNAPPAKTVYFTTNSIQTRLTTSKKAVPDVMQNALTDAFKGQNANRGAIQMHSQTAKYLQTRMKDIKDADVTPYGFRFHYNPSSVYLGYGAMDRMSPELMRDEMQVFNPVTPTSLGEINFDLYLNRLDDMSFITSNGTLKSGQFSIEPRDLYNEEVSADTLKQIYKKGTMYDLEFLFRAIHGGTNDVNSKFRGVKTSDIGWIARVPVELHLGDGLRYLLSINSIGVSHIVFNDRMVPMISVVKISGSRFFDNVPSKGKKTTP